MTQENRVDTGTLAEEMAQLSAIKRSLNDGPNKLWGTGGNNSEGNQAMTKLALEVLESLQEAVRSDQETLQYSFSKRLSCLEKGIRDYRRLSAYYSEIRFNPGESKIRDFFLSTAHIVNIPQNLPNTLWQLHYELGL